MKLKGSVYLTVGLVMPTARALSNAPVETPRDHGVRGDRLGPGPSFQASSQGFADERRSCSGSTPPCGPGCPGIPWQAGIRPEDWARARRKRLPILRRDCRKQEE